MRETKNLEISINTFNFKNCNNFQINQTIILTSELAETDVKVVAIEDIEEKAAKGYKPTKDVAVVKPSNVSI